MRTRMLLVRHCTADNSVLETYPTGCDTHHLTLQGHGEADNIGAEIARKLPGLDAIYTSPALRALETTYNIMNHVDYTPLTKTDLLRGRHKGSLTGKRKDSTPQRWRDHAKELGAETDSQLDERTAEFLRIVPSEGLVVVVTHDDPIGAIIKAATGMDRSSQWKAEIRVPKGSMTLIDFSQDIWERIRFAGEYQIPESWCDLREDRAP